MKKWYGPAGFNVTDSFVYNYFNAAHALVIGLTKSGGALGASLNSSLPRSIKAGYQVSNGGQVKLDSNRQAIADQYPQQIVKGPDGKPAAKVVGYVPGVDQSFGGFFKKTSPPPGRSQPPCVKHKFPWAGHQGSQNGVITEDHQVGVDRAAARRRRDRSSIAGSAALPDLKAMRDVDLDVIPGERRAILEAERGGENDAVQRRRRRLTSAGSALRPGRHSGTCHGRVARSRPQPQQSRLFLGLSVEDNIFLAIVGVGRGTAPRSSAAATKLVRVRGRGRDRRQAWRHRRRARRPPTGRACDSPYCTTEAPRWASRVRSVS